MILKMLKLLSNKELMSSIQRFYEDSVEWRGKMIELKDL